MAGGSAVRPTLPCQVLCVPAVPAPPVDSSWQSRALSRAVLVSTVTWRVPSARRRPASRAPVALFLRTTTPVGAALSVRGSPEAEVSSGNSGSSTRARTLLLETWTRLVLKIAAKVLSSTLLLWSISTSRWVAPRSAKKTPAPLWSWNRFQVMPTSRAPWSEKTPNPPVLNSLLAWKRLRQMRVGCSPLEPRRRPTPLSWKMVSRTTYPEWAGSVYIPGPFSAFGTPRMVKPSQVTWSARSWTVPVRSSPVTIDSWWRRLPVGSWPALAPLMVRRGVLTTTFSS
jgi:hypothetical protein